MTMRRMPLVFLLVLLLASCMMQQPQMPVEVTIDLSALPEKFSGPESYQNSYMSGTDMSLVIENTGFVLNDDEYEISGWVAVDGNGNETVLPQKLTSPITIRPVLRDKSLYRVKLDITNADGTKSEEIYKYYAEKDYHWNSEWSRNEDGTVYFSLRYEDATAEPTFSFDETLGDIIKTGEGYTENSWELNINIEKGKELGITDYEIDITWTSHVYPIIYRDLPATYTVDGTEVAYYSVYEDTNLVPLSAPYYNFVAFLIDGEKVTSIPAGHTGPISVETKWEPINYTVEVSGFPTGEETRTYTFNYGTKGTIGYEIRKETEQEGYYFQYFLLNGQWYDSIEVSLFPDDPATTLKLTGKFSPKYYYLTYDIGDGKFAETPVEEYTVEDSVTLPIPYKEGGYRFNHYLGSDGKTYTGSIPKGSMVDLTLTAVYEKAYVVELHFPSGTRYYYTETAGTVDLSALSAEELGIADTKELAEFGYELVAWFAPSSSLHTYPVYITGDGQYTSSNTITSVTVSDDANSVSVYPVLRERVWNGSKDSASLTNFIYDSNGRKVIRVYTAAQLAAMGSFSSVQGIWLENDLYLNNVPWTPLAWVVVSIDGRNHTIHDLNVSAVENAALIATAAPSYDTYFTIENLTIQKARISGDNAAVLVANYKDNKSSTLLGHSPRFKNITINNAEVAGTSKAALLLADSQATDAGQQMSINLYNIAVDTATITAPDPAFYTTACDNYYTERGGKVWIYTDSDLGQRASASWFDSWLTAESPVKNVTIEITGDGFFTPGSPGLASGFHLEPLPRYSTMKNSSWPIKTTIGWGDKYYWEDYAVKPAKDNTSGEYRITSEAEFVGINLLLREGTDEDNVYSLEVDLDFDNRTFTGSAYNGVGYIEDTAVQLNGWHSFRGTFKGNGHKITGLAHSPFGYLEGSAEISDLTVDWTKLYKSATSAVTTSNITLTTE